MSEKKEQIVVTKSKAYGYNYASLGDIAQQGFTIPKMKTGTENGKEYVYCYDNEIKDWIRGAEIVIPEMKGMNDSQKYGSALTFARRYSVMMVLGLVSDDDKKLETQAPTQQKNNLWDGLEEDKSLKDLANEFRSLYTKEEQERIYNGLKIDKAEDIGTINLAKYINFKKYGQKQSN
jgi:hypothetical protein